MLVGFFLRRIVTITLLAGSFWLGIKTDRLFSAEPAAAPVVADCRDAPDGT